MIDVSIIIVGTNELKFVFGSLDSITKSDANYKIEVILVDNASCDGTSDMVRKSFSNVRIIRSERKMGYIEANNMALKTTSGRYILILNSDIELKNDTIQVMVGFMDRHPDAAVSACKLVFDDGTLQLTCRRFPTPLSYIFRIPHFLRWLKIGKKLAVSRPVHRYLMMDYDHKKTIPVDWLLSAFFLMRSSAVREIGLLDERLIPPFYLEDVDWCFRAHLKGWRVYYVPEVYAVHHYKRGSVKRFSKLSIVHLLNIIIFFNKHALSMFLKKHRKGQR